MQFERTSASSRRFLPPAVAVSVVACALQPPVGARLGIESHSESIRDAGSARADNVPTLWIPLVKRTRAPFQGVWALPGGPTQWDETLTDTAVRAVRSAVGCVPGTLEQLYSFGSVERSAEAQRLVTIAYWALYGEQELAGESEAPDTPAQTTAHEPETPRPASVPRRWDDPHPVITFPTPRAGDTSSDLSAGLAVHPAEDDGSANVAWFSADQLPELAFDHAEIVATALERLRSKTEYADLAHRFLGAEFTLGRLRAVTEAVLGYSVDPANFRRQALAQGSLTPTGAYETGTRHRPARLYRLAEPQAHGTPTAAPRAASTAAHVTAPQRSQQ